MVDRGWIEQSGLDVRWRCLCQSFTPEIFYAYSNRYLGWYCLLSRNFRRYWDEHGLSSESSRPGFSLFIFQRYDQASQLIWRHRSHFLVCFRFRIFFSVVLAAMFGCGVNFESAYWLCVALRAKDRIVDKFFELKNKIFCRSH